MRQGSFGQKVGATCVDRVHEIELLHRQVLDWGEVDGAGIVDDDVDPPEGLNGLRDRLGDGFVAADVTDDRQGLAAGRLDLLGRSVDRALELRMGFRGLRQQRDIRPVLGCAQSDRQSDSTAAAAHDDRPSGQRSGGISLAEVAVSGHRSSPSSVVR